jgi:hypothetical protein
LGAIHPPFRDAQPYHRVFDRVNQQSPRFSLQFQPAEKMPDSSAVDLLFPQVDRLSATPHHRAMRSFAPIATLVLVAGWLSAMVFDLPMMALAVAVLCLGAVCADAARRRSPARGLGIALTAILAVLGATIATLLLTPPEDPGGLLIQVAAVAVLAPIVPLIYALTFGEKDQRE